MIEGHTAQTEKETTEEDLRIQKRKDTGHGKKTQDDGVQTEAAEMGAEIDRKKDVEGEKER